MTSGGDSLSACMSQSEPQMSRGEYLAERVAKIGLMEKQGEFLDKSLLTLSGGALGLTLTFLHERNATATGVWWAIIGMGMLVVSLLSVLFSLNFSQRSISLHIDALDEWCRANFSSGHPCEGVILDSPMAKVTLVANRIATAMLVFGVIFVSVFVSLNLLSRSGDAVNMQSNSKGSTGQSSPAPIERGAVIKPPPVQQPSQSSPQGNKK